MLFIAAMPLKLWNTAIKMSNETLCLASRFLSTNLFYPFFLFIVLKQEIIETLKQQQKQQQRAGNSQASLIPWCLCYGYGNTFTANKNSWRWTDTEIIGKDYCDSAPDCLFVQSSDRAKWWSEKTCKLQRS